MPQFNGGYAGKATAAPQTSGARPSPSARPPAPAQTSPWARTASAHMAEPHGAAAAAAGRRMSGDPPTPAPTPGAKAPQRSPSPAGPPAAPRPRVMPSSLSGGPPRPVRPRSPPPAAGSMFKRALGRASSGAAADRGRDPDLGSPGGTLGGAPRLLPSVQRVPSAPGLTTQPLLADHYSDFATPMRERKALALAGVDTDRPSPPKNRAAALAALRALKAQQTEARRAEETRQWEAALEHAAARDGGVGGGDDQRRSGGGGGGGGGGPWGPWAPQQQQQQQQQHWGADAYDHADAHGHGQPPHAPSSVPRGGGPAASASARSGPPAVARRSALPAWNSDVATDDGPVWDKAPSDEEAHEQQRGRAGEQQRGAPARAGWDSATEVVDDGGGGMGQTHRRQRGGSGGSLGAVDEEGGGGGGGREGQQRPHGSVPGGSRTGSGAAGGRPPALPYQASSARSTSSGFSAADRGAPGKQPGGGRPGSGASVDFLEASVGSRITARDGGSAVSGGRPGSGAGSGSGRPPTPPRAPTGHMGNTRASPLGGPSRPQASGGGAPSREDERQSSALEDAPVGRAGGGAFAFAGGDALGGGDGGGDGGALRMCDTCGRSFNAKAFERHGKVCVKVFCEKRKQYDMTNARVAGTEAAQFVKKGKGGAKGRAGGAAGAGAPPAGYNDRPAESSAAASKKAKWKRKKK
ncbi:hypothetical protein FOA52_014852 [Chlamydomonas sp. UWO 241]|nr:hypothetical protein FOA52_014852 [Chlamydomonas sp. UWO 241]